MDNEKDYIELIDRYISGEMNQNELAEFEKLKSEDENLAKELLIYEKLFEGIEKKHDEVLRKRLDQYYQEFLVEQTTKKTSSSRWIFFASGIAAALVVAFFLMWEPTIKLGDDLQVENIPTDTIPAPNAPDAEQPEQIEPKVPSDQRNKDAKEKIGIELGTTPKMALGGTKNLPTEQVRTARHPQSLAYIFDGKNLDIFGDPLLTPIKLEIFRNANGEYFFRNGEETYQFRKSTSRTTFERVSGSYGIDSETDDTILVNLKPITTLSTPMPSFEVRLSESKTQLPAYQFQRNELVIFGGLDVEKTSFFQIETESEVRLVLVSQGKVYELDGKAQEAIRPLPAPISPNSSLGMLIIGREPIEKKVKLAKK